MIPSVVTACLTILGTWQYAGFRSDGVDYPMPNPDLVLRFTFSEDNISTLRWYRTNESGYCERRAQYVYKDQLLYQKVIWVNPQNNRECANDTDMRMGQESTTQLQCTDQDMGFILDLDGKEFIYKLTKIN